MIGKLLLAGFSTVFGLLLLESGLRLAGYQAIYDVYSKPSVFWEYEPLLGWAHTPDSQGIYVGPRPWPIEFSAAIQINSQGLRGPEIEALPAEGLRVLLQGDSMVAAFEVDYEDTFGALLEDSLTEELGVPVQVVNAGVRGYGTDQSYLYFNERGHLLRPDLVIQYHSDNDPRNNITVHRMRRPFSKAAFALRDGELKLEGAPVPSYPMCSAYRMNSAFEVERISTLTRELVCRFQIALADRSALFTLLALRLTEQRSLLNLLYRLGSPDKEELIADDPESAGVGYETRLTAAVLSAFHDSVRESGSRFLLILPASGEPIREAVAREGVETLTLGALGEVAGDRDLKFKNDSHFNEAGHRALAARLKPQAVQILREQQEAKRASRASDPPRRR